jgi:hypothetical protein
LGGQKDERVLAMGRVLCWGAIVALLSLPLTYVAWSLHQMQMDTRTRENGYVVPRVAEDQVREIGYIYDLRVTRKWSERKKEIMWWVKVPQTGKINSCSWEYSYSGF